MWSTIPSRFRVQFHVTGPSPQSVILCCMVSSRLQFGQVLVGVKWMAASFEPTFVAGERPQTYALDRVATRTVQRLHNYQAKTSNINGQLMYMDS
jgi:hypothetical protein